MFNTLYRAIVAGNDTAYYEVIVEQATKVIGSIANPEGRSWQPDAATELATEFYMSGKHTNVLLRATDDDSLRALLYTAMRNRVIDGHRQTERGRLRRRVRTILGDGPYVERPAGFWRRPADPEDPFGGREADLIDATANIAVSVVRWNAEAARHSPDADRTSFLHLFDTIFDRANGAVPIEVLVRVLAYRLNVGAAPEGEALDLPDTTGQLSDTSTGPEEEVLRDDNEAEAASEALYIWEQLGADERLMIPYLDTSAREGGRRLGWGHTKAARVRGRLDSALADLFGDVVSHDREDVLYELRRIGDIL